MPAFLKRPHVFSPSLTVVLVFSNSHLCAYCSVISQSDLSRFTSSLFSTTVITDIVLLSFCNRSFLSHTHTDATLHHTHTKQATWIMSMNHSWTDVCACVFTVDIYVLGVGEWAASGASDWPTGTGTRQDADWIDVWRLACRFLCAM